MTKLPKQWRNWCASMHLAPYCTKGTGKHNWHYLEGRGRVWRVRYGSLQRGDTLEGFDRWALCDIVEYPLPKTRDEFQKAIASLLKE